MRQGGCVMKFKFKKLSVLLAVVGGLTLSAASMLGSNSSVFAIEVDEVQRIEPFQISLKEVEQKVKDFVDSYNNTAYWFTNRGTLNVDKNIVTIRKLSGLEKKIRYFLSILYGSIKYKSVKNSKNYEELLRNYDIFKKTIYYALETAGFNDIVLNNASRIRSDLCRDGFGFYSYDEKDGDEDKVKIAYLIKSIATKIATLMKGRKHLEQMLDDFKNGGSS